MAESRRVAVRFEPVYRPVRREKIVFDGITSELDVYRVREECFLWPALQKTLGINATTRWLKDRADADAVLRLARISWNLSSNTTCMRWFVPVRMLEQLVQAAYQDRKLVLVRTRAPALARTSAVQKPNSADPESASASPEEEESYEGKESNEEDDSHEERSALGYRVDEWLRPDDEPVEYDDSSYSEESDSEEEIIRAPRPHTRAARRTAEREAERVVPVSLWED